MAEEIRIFNSLKEAEDDGVLWGEDLIVLSKKHIDALLEGKAIKTDNSEYVQIIILREGDT